MMELTHHKHAKVSVGNISSIPSNIVRDILLRLDARSLFRCALVCRGWNALITTPHFVSQSSDRNFDSTSQVLFIKVCPCKHSAEAYYRCSEYVYYPHCRITYSLHWDNDRFDLIRTIATPAINDFWGTEVIGISNGLVCLAHKVAHKFILWNPAVHKFAWLPRAMPWDGGRYSAGFGFDRSSNDFKVVNLVHRFVDGPVYEMFSAWVFSYITWSWKHLPFSTSIPPCHTRRFFPHVLFNGVLHWTAIHRGGEEECYDFILTFDLSHEVFGHILLPGTVGTDIDSWHSIVTTGDSLLVIQVKGANDAIDQIVIWTMEQYGNHESWKIIFSTTTEVIDFLHILGGRTNGDLIVGVDGGQIRRYTPRTSTNVLTESMQNSVFFCYHTESLYLLEKGENVSSY